MLNRISGVSLLSAAAVALAVSPLAACAQGQTADAPLAMADQEVGQTFTVTMQDKPEPYTGPAVRNSPMIVSRDGRQLNLPEGFEATLLAGGLEHPRQALALPNGDVLIAEQLPGYLTMLRDDDGDGRADWIGRHAAQFYAPYGLAYRSGEILVADQQGLWTIAYQEGSLRPPYAQPRRKSETPEDQRAPGRYMDGQEPLSETGVFGLIQGHFNRDIALGPDGTIYVGVGSAGNLAVEPKPKCTIQAFNASGGNQRTVASGMRNPCGLAVHPDTGELFALVQERDGLGDVLVPDFLTEVQEGGFYGFPYSYIGSNPQPGFAPMAPDKVEAAIVPDLLFESHSATMDLAFYNGHDQFPEKYRDGAFVAMKGSWNRSEPTGYKVVFVPFEDGEPKGGYENFATGFWVGGEDRAEVWGRPSDVEVAPDGSLIVVDDTGGTVWRITYSRPGNADDE
ncbi:MAG: PQQ-dependent sugar dehydrogenase [Planctomycetota bacterium]